MSILKAPPKQLKNATLQVRLGEDLKGKLDKYAEFLDSTESYVVSEALKLVFNKDAEFKEWLEHEQAVVRESTEEHGSLAAVNETHPTELKTSVPKSDGGELFR